MWKTIPPLKYISNDLHLIFATATNTYLLFFLGSPEVVRSHHIACETKKKQICDSKPTAARGRANLNQNVPQNAGPDCVRVQTKVEARPPEQLSHNAIQELGVRQKGGQVDGQVRNVLDKGNVEPLVDLR